MFNIRSLFSKNNDMNKSNFKIVYEDGNIRNKVLSWCKHFRIDDLGELLIKLGFNVDDVIYLYENYGNLSEVFYSVNKDVIDNVNIIKFDYKNREITVGNNAGYKIFFVNYMEDKYEVELGYQKKKISDNISCFRTFKNNLFIVDNGDYELTFEVYTDFFINKDKLDNLEKYLIGLEFPIIVDDVYNKICNILCLEQSMMEMLNLSVTKNVGKKKVDMVLDNIMIQKGELVRFIKTSDAKRITVDTNGNWSYDKLDMESVFSLNYNDNSENKYSYRFNGNEDKYFTIDELLRIKDNAVNEIENVKKLTKNIFNK